MRPPVLYWKGILPQKLSSGIDPTFASIVRTGVGSEYKLNPRATFDRLCASKELKQTVVTNKGTDDSPRPVGWVLLSRVNQNAIVVFSDEAEFVVNSIRKEKTPMVYLFTCTALFTRAMAHFNNLKYFLDSLASKRLVCTHLPTNRACNVCLKGLYRL